jgi:hypothetical protein
VTSIGIARLCESLWTLAGEQEPFPRDLDALYTWALPLYRIFVPALSVAEIRRWLEQRGLAGVAGPQRRLRACLIARNGRGAVFVDGADPPEERRFSLAHEAGHFLLDYAQPRLRVQRALGSAALEILDGLRRPSLEERIDALLAGVELQPYIHLMERDAAGLACGAAAGSECAADAFALELLAPETEVLAGLRSLPPAETYAAQQRGLTRLLRTGFGLPAAIAAAYAARLLRAETGGPSTAEWLGLAPPDAVRAGGERLMGDSHGGR